MHVFSSFNSHMHYAEIKLISGFTSLLFAQFCLQCHPWQWSYTTLKKVRAGWPFRDFPSKLSLYNFPNFDLCFYILCWAWPEKYSILMWTGKIIQPHLWSSEYLLKVLCCPHSLFQSPPQRLFQPTSRCQQQRYGLSITRNNFFS